MDLIKLEIHGISYSENLSGAFALVLNESKGQRKLPVVIGGFEAQAIALALQKILKLVCLLHMSFSKALLIGLK